MGLGTKKEKNKNSSTSEAVSKEKKKYHDLLTPTTQKLADKSEQTKLD